MSNVICSVLLFVMLLPIIFMLNAGRYTKENAKQVGLRTIILSLVFSVGYYFFSSWFLSLK